jgi:hypothetical protein
MLITLPIHSHMAWRVAGRIDDPHTANDLVPMPDHSYVFLNARKVAHGTIGRDGSRLTAACPTASLA